MNDPETDEILGITRCARCGHRLDGEIVCPVCSGFDDAPSREGNPKWIYLTACFLSSPLSLYFLIKTDKLNSIEKVLAFSGCFLWFGIYRITNHFWL